MKKVIIFLVLILTITTTGCADSNTEPAVTPTPEITDAPFPEMAPPQEFPEEETNQASEDSAPEFTFADVTDLEFYFSSGAGGWRTLLYINDDGSFSGVHSDSDMGDIGEDYPNGTYYICQFNGSFTTPEKLNDYTYSFALESLEYEQSDAVKIIDGVRYVNSTPYGIEGGEEFHLYLPGTPLSELPEEYINWVGYGSHSTESAQEPILPFYGLYNVTEDCGFSSYKMLTPAEIINAEIESAEAADKEISQLLDDPYLTQADMNTYSYELYRIWDDTLNAIWNVLKNNLDSDTMDALTAEEIAWIAEKEAAVEEAGKDVEGGSLYPTVVNSVAAEYTRLRVYELAEYISE